MGNKSTKVTAVETPHDVETKSTQGNTNRFLLSSGLGLAHVQEKLEKTITQHPITVEFSDHEREVVYRKLIYAISGKHDDKRLLLFVLLCVVYLICGIIGNMNWLSSSVFVIVAAIGLTLAPLSLVAFNFSTMKEQTHSRLISIVTILLVAIVAMSPIFFSETSDRIEMEQNETVAGELPQEQIILAYKLSASGQISVCLLLVIPFLLLNLPPATLAMCCVIPIVIQLIHFIDAIQQYPGTFVISIVSVLIPSFVVVNHAKQTQIYSRLLWSTSRQGTKQFASVVHKGKSRFGLDKPITDAQNSSIEILRQHPSIVPLIIDQSKFEIVDEIGRGAMGEVYKATYCDTLVALKRIPQHVLNNNNLLAFRNEILLIQSLRHPNIVQLLGVTCNDLRLVGAIFELMPRNSLRNVLQDSSIDLKWEDPKCKLAIDVAKGMTYLHDQNVIHRDLKTENILVSSTFTCKIADFGTSCKTEDLNATQIGTPFWRAPEIIRAEKYSIKADVYSYALILLEIQLQQNPFEDMSQMEAFELPHKVAHENWRLPIPEDAPTDIRTLIEDCWNPDPDHRPSFLIVLRRLQKFLRSLSDSEEPESNLEKLMLDHMIMSGRYVKETYNDGECIIKAGEIGEHCYIVLKGEVNIMRQHVDFKAKAPRHTAVAKMQLIRVVPTGSYFGEMALLAHNQRVASCFAKGAVTCIKFDRQAFLEVYDDEIHGKIAARVVKLLQTTTSEENPTTESENDLLQKMDSFRTAGGSFVVRQKIPKEATNVIDEGEDEEEFEDDHNIDEVVDSNVVHD